jgi:dipeptidyl aminopeptidase/acylaminoacyl peptidase
VAQSVAARVARPAEDDLEREVGLLAKVGYCVGPSFSANGDRVAFVSDLSGIPQAWTVAVEGGWPDRVSALDDQVVGLEWSPRGDRIALVVAPGGGLNTQIYVVRPNGSDLRLLTPGGKENNAFSRWSADGRTLFITSSRDDSSHWDAFAIDLDTGSWSEPIARTRGIARVQDDNTNSILLYRVVARGDSDIFLVDRRTPAETRLTPHGGQAQFWDGRLRDGWMLCGTNADRERNAFARVPVDGSGRIEIIAERDDAELEQIAYSDDRQHAALVWNAAGQNELEVMDLSTGRRTEVTVPAEGIGAPTWSRDGRRLAFVATGPSVGPPDIWIVDQIGADPRRLTRSPHPGVDLSRLVSPRLEEFVAADGLELSGWLYVPRTYAAPGPVVLSFHGGPEAQERPSFNRTYEALLSRGIAVFAPNVRGSSGFGKTFVHLDDREKRFDGIRDIAACVDHVSRIGVADPQRIGITGGSYGGYMTMAGITEFPERFAAAVCVCGIVNFRTFFQKT